MQGRSPQLIAAFWRKYDEAKDEQWLYRVGPGYVAIGYLLHRDKMRTKRRSKKGDTHH
jgi:hypothetical protein